MLKSAIRNNVMVRGDPTRQYYLSITTATHGFGAVFFQLGEEIEKELKHSPPKGKERVIQFISQAFIDTETRYGMLEREYLAILRSLKDVRYQVLQSPYPVVVYTNIATFLRKKDDLKGRMAAWQVRMGEFRIDPRPLKTQDLSVGMAKLPAKAMDRAWTMEREWEDVCTMGREDTVNTSDRVYVPEGPYPDYTLILFVDGACRGNGTYRAKASVGIYAGLQDPLTMGSMLSSHQVGC